MWVGWKQDTLHRLDSVVPVWVGWKQDTLHWLDSVVPVWVGWKQDTLHRLDSVVPMWVGWKKLLMLYYILTLYGSERVAIVTQTSIVYVSYLPIDSMSWILKSCVWIGTLTDIPKRPHRNILTAYVHEQSTNHISDCQLIVHWVMLNTLGSKVCCLLETWLPNVSIHSVVIETLTTSCLSYRNINHILFVNVCYL